jgi:hypothetical protein
METKKIQHERDIDRWLNEGGRDLDESRREPMPDSARERRERHYASRR